MQPFAVDLVLLRSTAPDLPLAVGRVLAARVIERHGPRHGLLNLAGAYLAAELPDGVQPGERMRLAVREITADRVVLQQLVATPPPVEVPLPPELRVVGLVEERPREGDEDARVVALRCESDALGNVELRIALASDRVHALVALAGGPPLEHARAHAGTLRSALSAATGVPAEVEIAVRREPLDVYA